MKGRLNMWSDSIKAFNPYEAISGSSNAERKVNMETLKRKLSSRKLWAAVAGVVTGLAMVFGLDGGIIADVAGAVVALAGLGVYIVTEGKVDAAAVGQAAQAVQDAAEAVAGTSPADGDPRITGGGILFTAYGVRSLTEDQVALLAATDTSTGESGNADQ